MLNIRFANQNDTALILEYIRELAEYEKLLDEVEVTKEALHESLFGKNTYAEVLMAEYEDKPAGFALFFHNFSTFTGRPGIYLEDLYIRPPFRSLGIGKALLQTLAQLCVDRDCKRLEWWVLNWNQKAIDFYLNIGAKSMDEWTVFRVSGPELNNLAKTKS